MKKVLLILGALAGISVIAQTTVHWQSLGNFPAEGTQPAHYIQRITVTGQTGFDALAFNQFARQCKTVNPADTLIEIVPGYYKIVSPRFRQGMDTVVVDIVTRGSLINTSYAPDGFHTILEDGSTQPVTYVKETLTSLHQWRTATKDPMPYGGEIYGWNNLLHTDYTPGPYDIIPSFKSIELAAGNEKSTNPEIILNIDPRNAHSDNPEYAEIDIRGNQAIITAADTVAAKGAMNVLRAKVLEPNKNQPLPDARLVYAPDFRWRGLMIDIARNYIGPEALKAALQLMADNGLNRLHFHPVDDEAWRLEIRPLPELTQVGARRGYAENEDNHLFQIFTGNGNPDDYRGTSNGYLTREQFIDLLRFADSLGIQVVTEIESPGHARAAIKAMEHRAKKGDPTFRLIHDGDTSAYTSAQSFHDNVMNPALESTYRFMDVVFNELIDMYKEAGVPLPGIHIGGDEVARGAWNGSEVARAFMDKQGIEDQHALHAYFVKRIAHMLAAKGVPVFGWQEIALGHGPEYDAEIAPLTGGVDCWSTIRRKDETPVPVQSVNGGYPTILSNVEHLYFDLSYSPNPQEPGLNWGGHVNEFTAFDAYAHKLCPVDSTSRHKILGLSAQCFGETLRDPSQWLMYLTPKMSGLAERAAHADTTYTVPQFNAIVGLKELPMLEERYKSLGFGRVHMNQPGVTEVNGLVFMNAPYTGGEIHYTTDSTEPTADSPVYSDPFPVGHIKEIRARYFRNGAESVTTYAFFDL